MLAHDGNELCARVERSLHDIVRDHLQAACSDIEPGLRALATRVVGIGALGCEIEHLGAWQRLARTALTLKGDWRKPRGVNRSLGTAYEEESARDDLRECIEQWSGMDGALEHLRELAACPNPC